MVQLGEGVLDSPTFVLHTFVSGYSMAVYFSLRSLYGKFIIVQFSVGMI